MTVTDATAPAHPIVRRFGGSVLLNPRRYGAALFTHYGLYRLSVFCREEACAIVDYLRIKQRTESTRRGSRRRSMRSGSSAPLEHRRPDDWWVSYVCALGHRHREKIGPKAVARAEHHRLRLLVRREGYCPRLAKEQRPRLFDHVAEESLAWHARTAPPPERGLERERVSVR